VNMYAIKSSHFSCHELATESRNENAFFAFRVQGWGCTAVVRDV
jgi:hypothetical protein